MRSQELLFAASAVLLIGLVSALVVFTGGEQAAAAVPAPDSTATAAAPAPPPGPEPVVVQDPPVPVQASNARGPVDTHGLTSGVILGDIVLAASAVPRLQSVTVSVIELRNPVPGSKDQPFHRVVPVPKSIGTPVFEIREIPFSEHGYVVRASSPGLNGSQQTVQVTAAHPCQEVRLLVSPGVACSILLRDQEQAPVTETEVTIVPTGEPPGRAGQHAKSDNYGSAVFQDVLAGDYLVYAGHLTAPLAEPAELTVLPGTGSIRAQGITVVVPRGKPLTVAVNDLMDHGIADAQVKLLATDKTRLTQLEAQTDWTGHATFPFLAPGRYQVDVFKTDFERRSATLTVTEAEPIAEQAFRLVRLR